MASATRKNEPGSRAYPGNRRGDRRIANPVETLSVFGVMPCLGFGVPHSARDGMCGLRVAVRGAGRPALAALAQAAGHPAGCVRSYGGCDRFRADGARAPWTGA